MKIVILLLLLLLCLLEAAVTSLPIVLSGLLLFYILRKDSFVFILAFLAGIILDVFSLNQLGETSSFFLIFLLLIFAYERKFEIETIPFVGCVSLVGSFSFLAWFGFNFIWQAALTNAGLTTLIFCLLKYFSPQGSLYRKSLL